MKYRMGIRINRTVGLIVFMFTPYFCHAQESIENIEEQIQELNSNYYFSKVEDKIKTIHGQFPNSIRAQYLIADWSHFTMNYEKADSLYADILKKDSINIAALNGRAMIAFDNEQIESSLKFIRKALETDSSNVNTWINFSKILLENRNRKAYIDAINKALEIDSLNSAALTEKGFYYSSLQYDIIEGAKYFNKAIEINPLNRKAHHYLGRGYSPYQYENDIQSPNKQLVIVDSLLRYNQFESAYKLISLEYLKDSTDINILKLKAAAEFHMGKYRKTIEYAFKMLELKPNYGLAHYFIAESLKKLENKHNTLMKKFKSEFIKQEVTDYIPFIDDVFINYHQCEKNLQKIIRINTEAFGGFIEALSISGATVYFMDFHHLMYECPYLKNIKGTKSIDFRLYDDIKGQGGYHMSSNKLQQTNHMYGLFNVAFHEFAHLIQWLFTYEQNAELMRLFSKAKTEKRTLDWYADMNVQEYFAQGVEAYLSERKLPGQSDITNNTKNKLFEKDIELFKFIQSLVNQKSYQQHIIQAYILRSRYVSSSEDAILLLKNAFSKYPNSPELLIEIGIIHRENRDYQNAENIHKQVVDSYPNNFQAKLELSYDIFLQGSNIDKSISILEDLKYEPEFDSKMYCFLGFYYSNYGDYEKAIKVFKKAQELNPYPDPYDISLPDSYYLLAKAQIATEDYISAEENLQKSLSINRINVEVYAELAFINYQLKNRKEAEKYIKRAMQLDQANKRVMEVNKLLKTK